MRFTYHSSAYVILVQCFRAPLADGDVEATSSRAQVSSLS